jgi:predicted RNA methylase
MRLPKDARRKLGYSPTVVDVFCGCGGMSEGFRRAGFRQLLGVDVDVPAAQSYAANFGCPVYSGPIESFVDELREGTNSVKGSSRLTAWTSLSVDQPVRGFRPSGRCLPKASEETNTEA